MELRKLKDDLSELIRGRIRAVQRATTILKIVILMLSAIGGWAAIEMSPPGTPSSWPAVGRIALGLIFLVAVTLLFGEGDSTAEMRKAHDALNKADELEKSAPNLSLSKREILRLTHLFVAIQAIRGVIEQSVRLRVADPEPIIRILFGLARHPLSVGIDFDISDEWTVCVYRAEYHQASPDILKCVAHIRAIDCDISSARTWPEGVGVAGISYANRREVIVPDLRAGNLGNLFNVGPNQKSYDEKRYRSFAVVPVSLEAGDKPWGVVVATSSKPGHFSPQPGPGLHTAEAIRITAGMIALVVACCAAAAPVAPPADPEEPLRV